MCTFDRHEASLHIELDVEDLSYQESNKQHPEQQVLLDGVADVFLITHADVDHVEQVLEDESVEHNGHVH